MWKFTLGIQGMAPVTISSMLGWVAAVMAIVSPSQPKPAVIQRTSISAIGGSPILLSFSDVPANFQAFLDAQARTHSTLF